MRVWPLRRPALWQLGKGGRALLAVTSVGGLAVHVHVLDDGPVGDADRAAAEWLEDQRTPTLNSLTHWGSMLSDTLVKVGLVAVVGGTVVLVWRRWHDGVFLAVAVLFEATVFVIASFIVGRDRPPVEQLDSVPPVRQLPVRPLRRGGRLLRGAVPRRVLAHPQPCRPSALRRRRRRRAACRGASRGSTGACTTRST